MSHPCYILLLHHISTFMFCYFMFELSWCFPYIFFIPWTCLQVKKTSLSLFLLDCRWLNLLLSGIEVITMYSITLCVETSQMGTSTFTLQFRQHQLTTLPCLTSITNITNIRNDYCCCHATIKNHLICRTLLPFRAS